MLSRNNLKQQGTGLAVGGAVGFVMPQLQQNIEALNDHWWAEGAALLATGVLTSAKSQRVGRDFAVLAGRAFAHNYQLDQFQQNKMEKSPVPGPFKSAKLGPAPQQQGQADAGYLQQPFAEMGVPDAGYLQDPMDREDEDEDEAEASMYHYQ
jgi:hypothetical protein